ncbi:chorion class B protein M2807-like [Bombyx mori]|uniref:Chorion early B n=1 Tax=Bombyx mori TaxID=7091 RepID=A0A8R2C6M4_BOMMO|nr:chorion class B protein M2807-like isoform X2 [Bombyx mori]
MTYKLIFISFLVCSTQGRGRFGSCGCGGWVYGNRGYNALGNDIIAASALGASHGGGLAVVTTSAAPTGLDVTSENMYEGTVGICGSLPFLGAAAVEGSFLAAGAGDMNYGCGDGAVGIVAERGSSYAGGLSYNPGYVFNYGGLRVCGCKCGAAWLKR